MVKVFGILDCPGCHQLLALLITKGVKYEYYNVEDREGLTLLASYGLAGEELSPVVTDAQGNLLDFDEFVVSLSTKDK